MPMMSPDELVELLKAHDSGSKSSSQKEKDSQEGSGPELSVVPDSDEDKNKE